MNVLSTKANSTVVKANFSPRNMDFAFTPAALPRYYADNNPLLTAIMTTLSAAIPEGERFFVESVRHFRDRVSDPVLKKRFLPLSARKRFTPGNMTPLTVPCSRTVSAWSVMSESLPYRSI